MRYIRAYDHANTCVLIPCNEVREIIGYDDYTAGIENSLIIVTSTGTYTITDREQVAFLFESIRLK